MTRVKGRTQLSAKLRVELLERAGHHLAINADTLHATVAVVRADGLNHTITITADDLTPTRRNGEAFKKYPQSTLISMAIHAACDWSDDTDWERKLKDALAVDPADCVCVLCSKSKHIPLERAQASNIAAILLGEQDNNTGYNVEVSITCRVAAGQDLDLSKPPLYAEARILDTGTGTYRRYDIGPWWNDILNHKKGK